MEDVLCATLVAVRVGTSNLRNEDGQTHLEDQLILHEGLKKVYCPATGLLEWGEP